MHKLLSTRYTYYQDFYDNRKEYEQKGIDNCYVPRKEWMDELGKEYYLIWSPQTKSRTRLEVVKGTIGRDSYGAPKVVKCIYLDKPFKGAYWDEYFPRYCWGSAYEFMNVTVTDDNKLDCLVFDNEKEARDFCDRYNDWLEIKNEQEIEEYLASSESKKMHSKRLKQIKALIKTLDKDNTNTYTTIDAIYEAIGKKIGWEKYIN